MDKVRDELSRYLLDEYKTWAGRIWKAERREATRVEFAESYLGIGQSSFSQYVNKWQLPNIENADKIAAKLGTRIYKILSYQPRVPGDPFTQYICENAPKLTDAEKQTLQLHINRLLTEQEEEERHTMTLDPMGA